MDHSEIRQSTKADSDLFSASKLLKRLTTHSNDIRLLRQALDKMIYMIKKEKPHKTVLNCQT